MTSIGNRPFETNEFRMEWDQCQCPRGCYGTFLKIVQRSKICYSQFPRKIQRLSRTQLLTKDVFSSAEGLSLEAILRNMYPDVILLAWIHSANARTGQRWLSLTGRAYKTNGFIPIHKRRHVSCNSDK